MNIQMAKEWLKAAHYDLLVIEEILNNENLTSMVAFHSQQTIEKSLKAVLELHQREVPKIHNIKKLFSLVKDILTIDLNDKLIFKINSLYIESRYPGDLGLLPSGKPTIDEAKEFYDFAKDIFDEICNILNIDKKEILQ